MNGAEKRFEHGDIVYWHRQKGNRHYVEFGMVDEKYPGVYQIDLLEAKENRIVDGIPYSEFPNVTEWRKLPKGWTYNTKLFELDWETYDVPFPVKLNDPASIKKAYEYGYLVKAINKDHTSIDTEITKEGYRLVKRVPRDMWVSTSVTVEAWRVYDTFEEAKKEVDDYNAELKRQASLTDYEWSVENIDRTLDRWAKLYGHALDTKMKYREFLLSLKNVEDIETRISDGNVQWRYENKKRWSNVEIIS